MVTIRKFSDLETWKESHKLTLLVYKYTKGFPKSETFGLISQLRRAVVSVESCIAEGFSRYHYKERLLFYYRSRGSLAEVQSQSITARDLKYLTKKQFTEIFEQSEKTGVILGGLIRKTEQFANKKTS
jgi:four helix bundle protein